MVPMGGGNGHGGMPPTPMHGNHFGPPPINPIFQQLLPYVRQVMEVMLPVDNEESVHAMVSYIMCFRYVDGTHILYWAQQPSPWGDMILRGKVLEALLYWVQQEARNLDLLIPQMTTMGSCQGLAECRRKLEASGGSGGSSPSAHNMVLLDFLHALILQLLYNREASSCLAAMLSRVLLWSLTESEILTMVEYPALLLAEFIRKVEEMTAKAAKVVMQILQDTEQGVTPHEAQQRCLPFFRYFTVDRSLKTSFEHVTPTDPAFLDSDFQIHLIDTFASLLELLEHVELRAFANGYERLIAVDLEGKASSTGWNRYGTLCLMQLTFPDRPKHTHVVDIHVLGGKCFTVQARNGTSIKRLLEDASIRKVWWDCRNDVDVLWNQYNILPKGVFDLQIAEVAVRRSSGKDVRFVMGLQKVLMQSQSLLPDQRAFAETIDTLGKNLYEPNYGGNYEIFEHRPLNQVILIYAAHDTHYQLVLYRQWVNAIDEGWLTRVLGASHDRSRWGLSPKYNEPSREAPDL